MFENVQTILNDLNGSFKGRGFFTEPDSDLLLHVSNILPQYGGSQNINKMITLKKDYEQGDLQLTMALMTVAGKAVHLLDCDLDENRNIVLNSRDLVKHLFNGGTSPISMHEYIVEGSAQNSPGAVSTVDLGYHLVGDRGFGWIGGSVKIILTVGDSVCWGQGLKEEHKFDYLFAQAKALQFSRVAHSGAVIGTSSDTSREVEPGEIPVGSPSLWQ